MPPAALPLQQCTARAASAAAHASPATGPLPSHLPPSRGRYREAFEALGTSLEAQGIQLDRVQPAAYRCWFGDGSRLDLLNDEAAMAAQLEAVEPGAAEGYRWGWGWGQRNEWVLPARRSSRATCCYLQEQGSHAGGCSAACQPRAGLLSRCAAAPTACRRRFLKMARMHLRMGAPVHGSREGFPARGVCMPLRQRLQLASLLHLAGVPYFIDRDFEELANARGLQVRRLRLDWGRHRPGPRPVPHAPALAAATCRRSAQPCVLILRLPAFPAFLSPRTCCPSCPS